MISKIFEWCATGQYSLDGLARKVYGEGFSYKNTGKPVPKKTMRDILRNPFYNGVMRWGGKTYQGAHEPIVSTELWKRTQDVFEERSTRNLRRGRYEFLFSQLLTCANCGCAIVGEMKKGKYIYYHCANYKRRCREGGKLTFVREDALKQQFVEMFGQLCFDDKIFKLIRQALQESHADEQREHDEAVAAIKPT